MRNTQLILYPQAFNGVYNSTSFYNLQEYVSNYQFISGRFSAFTIAGSHIAFWYVTGNTLAIGGWNGIHTTNCAAPTFTASNRAELTSHSGSGVSTSLCAIGQRLTNLSGGIDYEVKVDIHSVPSNSFLLEVMWRDTVSNGVVDLNNTIQTTGVHTFTFTTNPNQTEVDLFVIFKGQQSDTLSINSISIKEQPNTTNVSFTDIQNGQVICDLYEDEAIPLNLSIDEFKNIAEQTKSYSKDFMLPGTKRNNKIFNEIFEVTRSTLNDDFTLNPYVFNPYVKTKAVVKVDTFTVFEGYLQLNDIIEKEEEISYNVNVFSESITLKDKLENLTIQDLDFAELEHDYTRTNIINSWTGGLILSNNLPTGTLAGTAGTNTTDVIKYPFCDWTGNLSLTGTVLNLQNLEQGFRPFLKCKYLLDLIFSKANFTFESDFLNSTDFTELYMDFNWGEGVFSVDTLGREVVEFNTNSDQFFQTSFTKCNFDSNVFGTSTNFNLSTDRFTSPGNNVSVHLRYFLRHQNTSTLTSQDGSFRIAHFDSSNNLKDEINRTDFTIGSILFGSSGGNRTESGVANILMQTGDYLELQFKAENANKIRQGRPDDGAHHFEASFAFSSTGTSINDLLTRQRGEIKLFDLFNSFRKMFNLVVLEDKTTPSNLIIEPYNDVFIDASSTSTINAKELNWTDKIDVNETKLQPIENLKKEAIFTYKSDDDNYGLQQYKKLTKKEYGVKEFIQRSYDLIKDKETIETEVFSPTFMRPPIQGFSNILTIPSIYKSDDTNQEHSDYPNEPKILYDIGVKTITTGGYTSPAQNGDTGFSTQTTFLQFSHTSEIPTTNTTLDYNFGETGLVTSMGNIPVNNLFNTYWSKYYTELYHPDTRVLTLQVYLTPSDINTFNFFDKVTIKNRVYRVNKIEYKAEELSTVEFILLS